MKPETIGRIDSYEYMEIINRLKDKFHMNTCSKCK